MKEKVFLQEQLNYDVNAICEKAERILKSAQLDITGKTILLKPSFVYPARGEQVKGIITQPEFIGGVVRALSKFNPKEIFVAENSVVGPARIAFLATGVLKFIKGYAKPLYLDEHKHTVIKIKNPLAQEVFTVPQCWLDVDIFISLPKIKVNLFSEVSLSVKNSMGFLTRTERLICHDYRLHKKLADLYKVRPPDFVLVDSIYAGEGQGPMLAVAHNLGVIIAGKNPLAVDAVSCHFMGFNPFDIEHLKYLYDEGFGPLNLEEIEVENRELLKKSKYFVRPQWELEGLSNKLNIYKGTKLYCPGGCVGMIRGILDPWIAYYGSEGIQEMNIIVGKPIEGAITNIDKSKTIVVGDCVKEYRNLGLFASGCPPYPIDIGLLVLRRQGFLQPPLGFFILTRGYISFINWALKEFFLKRKNPLNLDDPIKLPILLIAYTSYYIWSIYKKILELFKK